METDVDGKECMQKKQKMERNVDRKGCMQKKKKMERMQMEKNASIMQKEQWVERMQMGRKDVDGQKGCRWV